MTQISFRDQVAQALSQAAAMESPTTPAQHFTQADLERWQAAPVAVPPQEHERECYGGFVTVVTAGDSTAVTCPVCAAARATAAFRKQMVNAGIDGRYLTVEWDDLELLAPLDRLAEACTRINRVLSSGACLLLHSEATGSGKTQAAMLCAKAALRAGKSAYVTNIARLSVDVREGYRSDNGLTDAAAIRKLAAPDLLVIDDLGAGETDAAAVERRLLFLALDERQTHRKSTIVTSNLAPADLVGVFGARIFGRLQPLSIYNVNHGKNFRVINTSPEELW